MNQVQFNYDDVKDNYDDNKGGVQRERGHFGGWYFDENQQKGDDENDKKKTNTMKMTNKKQGKYNGTWPIINTMEPWSIKFNNASWPIQKYITIPWSIKQKKSTWPIEKYITISWSIK